MPPREYLIDTTAYLAPAHVLDGLSPADADRLVDGAPHSIAEIVTHLAFWQGWFLGRCEGSGVPMPSTAAHGWIAPAPGTWTAVRTSFVEGLERVVAFAATADATRPIAPALEFPPIAHYTVGDVLVHIATHNAHHLGQVVLLRQLMSRWPPPAGSWAW
jgi:uncharacterized damage-inducible protein DinB